MTPETEDRDDDIRHAAEYSTSSNGLDKYDLEAVKELYGWVY